MSTLLRDVDMAPNAVSCFVQMGLTNFIPQPGAVQLGTNRKTVAFGLPLNELSGTSGSSTL